ncbi:Queuine tRNA-ribosyltransferase subunit QTRTD1 [Smittium mucronatum]|uniref:Queuine tRNA-ribosyltransferase accessory subunit 2 n=1 Tax=Smittium mucronatum TaxID=133383 RepID=A0A1R0H3W1_9FUNG|nr:Queuine tRNA-ribosyltransferase subunit QTRTD1 [Smittium mucronatum]
MEFNSDDSTSLKNIRAKKSIETPNFIKYTNHGLQPHILPDIEKKFPKPDIEQVYIEHFLDRDVPCFADYKEGIHKFLGVEDTETAIFFDILDPTSNKRSYSKPSNSYLTAETGGGLRKISPELYSQLIKNLSPEMYVSLADYLFMTADEAVKGKKIAKSIERSINWFDKCVKESEGSAVFVPLMGSVVPEARAKFVNLLQQRRFDGVVLIDYSTQIGLAQQLDLAKPSLISIPSTIPRYLLGFSAPDEVIIAIRNGIDIFLSTYPYAVTEQGFASIYSFPANLENKEPLVDRPFNPSLNLWESSMSDDFSPISKSCECYTCQKHTRAYINHLLNTQEMLATVLLQIHNLHVYDEFYKNIRKSIKDMSFNELSEHFLTKYNSRFASNSEGTNAAIGSQFSFNESLLFDPRNPSPTTKEKIKRFDLS